MENSVLDEYKNDLVKFQNWIKTKPELPQNLSIIVWIQGVTKQVHAPAICFSGTLKFF